MNIMMFAQSSRCRFLKRSCIFSFANPLLEKDSANFYLMVADYHALTSVRDGQALRANIYNTVRDYLAVGVDPEHVTLFRQSDNPDHMEMGWNFVLIQLVREKYLL